MPHFFRIMESAAVRGASAAVARESGDFTRLKERIREHQEKNMSTNETAVNAAQKAIDTHTEALRIDADGNNTAFWHLLASLIEYSDANGIDFDAELDSVRQHFQSQHIVKI